jgi:hypothetical protein
MHVVKTTGGGGVVAAWCARCACWWQALRRGARCPSCAGTLTEKPVASCVINAPAAATDEGTRR